tara:strand:- start:184 stop:570 length:387 start_codon:yes stop_codon:yes gene_type:complete
MSYNPSFDIDFTRGVAGENLAKKFLFGTHEVKTDYKTVQTGNFYIETWQQPNGKDWKPSGINTTEANFWVQASPIGTGGIFISTSALKELLREKQPPEAEQPVVNSETAASKGRLVKASDVMRKLGFL